MISSRRLAREWALKILYQADIGKTSLKESQDASLERLRREFVQRGSRIAGGSFLEEFCLEAVTLHLTDLLPHLYPALENAVRETILQCFTIGGFWRETALEFTSSRQSFSVLLETPRQSLPVTLPIEKTALPASIKQNAKLSAADKKRLLHFAEWAREALPQQAVAAFTKEVQAGRPEGASLKLTQEYVQEQWRMFTRSMAERWEKAGQIVQKQTGDWLRVTGFTIKLVTGVNECLQELDEALKELSTGWSLDRQVSVDRNILRMAAFEMLRLRDIPASATINEAVELAKKYSTSESGRFVNGVLGGLAARQNVAEENGRGRHYERAAEIEPGDEVVDIDEIADREELEQV